MKELHRSAAILQSLLFLPSALASISTPSPIAPIGEPRLEDPYTSPLINGCPQTCQIASADPSNWAHIHQLDDLSSCKEQLLFDFNIYNDLSLPTTIRTCAGAPTAFKAANVHFSKTPVQWAEVDHKDLDAVE